MSVSVTDLFTFQFYLHKEGKAYRYRDPKLRFVEYVLTVTSLESSEGKLQFRIVLNVEEDHNVGQQFEKKVCITDIGFDGEEDSPVFHRYPESNEFTFNCKAFYTPKIEPVFGEARTLSFKRTWKHAEETFDFYI